MKARERLTTKNYHTKEHKVSLSMSVPERMVLRKELRYYEKFRRLVKQMGKPAFINSTSSAEISAALKKINQQHEWSLMVEEITGESRWGEDDHPTYWGGETYLNDEGSLTGYHPVFLLAEHFMGIDGDSFEAGGYLNLRNRGDCLIIPGYLEIQEPWFMAISFHKGDTTTEYVYFPEGDSSKKLELYELITFYETR